MVKVQQLLKLQANVNKPGASWEKGMEVKKKNRWQRVSEKGRRQVKEGREEAVRRSRRRWSGEEEEGERKTFKKV